MTSLTFTYSCPSNESRPQKSGVKKHPFYATHCLESFLLGPTAHVQFFVPLEFCFSRFSAD